MLNLTPCFSLNLPLYGNQKMHADLEIYNQKIIWGKILPAPIFAASQDGGPEPYG